MRKLEMIGIIGIYLIFILLSFGFGYRAGQTNMAETCLNIIGSVDIKEVSIDINETELVELVLENMEKMTNNDTTRR